MSRRTAWLGLPALLLLAARTSLAIDTTPPLADPQEQQRYLALTHELRCVECQNESIADSPVSLAADLRREVHDLVAAGKSDDQVRDYMVARYGEFILFRPRMDWRNAWLWSAPVVLLLTGIVTGGRIIRQRQRLLAQDTAPLETDSSEQDML
jgi:cytochrome c-type biogenesis protein CcmH